MRDGPEGVHRYGPRMGFSPLGLAIGLAVLAPNLLLLRFPPTTPWPAVRVPWSLAGAERAGQAMCLVAPAITATAPFHRWWAVPVAAALGLYYALWFRYLARDRTVAALYRPVVGIPVPMAVLPVVVFLGTAAWLTSAWTAAAALVLAAGHVPASVLVARCVGVPDREVSGAAPEIRR